MNKFESKTLEEKINVLREQEIDNRTPWNKGLFIKALILSPSLIYLIGFIFINKNDNKIIFFTLLAFAIGLILALLRLLSQLKK